MENNNMYRAISQDGSVSVCAVDSTNIVSKMEQLHSTSAVISAAFGRVLTAASLMGSGLKNEQDSLTLRLDGGGQAGVVLAVSDGQGNVRGYATHPVVELPLRADGKLDVGTAIGTKGTLSIIKDLGMKEPYIGQVPLVSGEVAEDITSYYNISEQTPSVCALGVLVNPDLSIRCAGGFLLQLLPGAAEATINIIEKNIKTLPSITNLLSNAHGPKEIIQLIMEGLNPTIISQQYVEYRCYCSREKTLDILASLGKAELTQMKTENPTAQVECHFCNKNYIFQIDDVLSNMQK